MRDESHWVFFIPHPSSLIPHPSNAQEQSPPILTPPLSARQNMALHRLLEFLLGGAFLQIQHGVECVELEIIAMRLAGWRGGTAVAKLVEVVLPLLRSIGERLTGWRPLRQL